MGPLLGPVPAKGYGKMVQLARPLLAENRILVGSIQYQYLIERLKMSGRRYEIPEAILILESTVHSIYVETRPNWWLPLL